MNAQPKTNHVQEGDADTAGPMAVKMHILVYLLVNKTEAYKTHGIRVDGGKKLTISLCLCWNQGMGQERW